ncbi:MAG: protease complex subunit PrcB family protein [Armatimonadetes bacterium]|nr:protease complex subunit PrcB family protein [Armatimonadota bacterium]
MKKTRLLLILGLCLTMAIAAVAQPYVKWRTLSKGTDSKQTKYSFNQFQVASDWQNMWRAIGQRGNAPSVNFDKEAVLFINLETQNKACTSVYVQTVDYKAGDIIVKAVRSLVDHDQKGTSNPYVAIAYERIAGTPKIQIKDICEPVTFVPNRRWGSGYDVQFPVDIAFEVELDGKNCDIAGPLSLVIQDRTTLRAYWDRLFFTMRASDVPDLPQIDFRDDFLVAIHLGTKSQGNYGLGVYSIKVHNPQETVIQWYEDTPPAGAMSTMQITQPFVLIRVPRTTPIVKVQKMMGKPFGY